MRTAFKKEKEKLMSIGKKSRKQVEAIRQTVYERDNHTCVVHGSLWSMLVPCGGSLTIQHRVTRGMGSSAKYDDAPFLLSMCSIHNGLEPASAEFRAFCERQGYSIPRWAVEQTPISRIPVKYEDGWYLLSATGKHGIPEPVAADLFIEIYGEEN
jgi:hypothetical protein